MKKVLLINTNSEKAPYPVLPLGLGLVAGAIANAYEVRLFDATFRKTDGLRELLRDFQPDYIGLGIRNIDDVVMGSDVYYLDGIRDSFMPLIREESAAPVILGGAGFSVFGQAILWDFGADYGVIGEGERVFPLLLQCLDKGGDPSEIPGVLTPDAIAAKPLDIQDGELDLPPAHLDRWLDWSPYSRRGSYSIQTKRGCKLNCLYCVYPTIEGRQYRLRPVNQVVDEIEDAQQRLGDVTFEFVDSTFNHPLSHALDICREIIRRGLRVRLRTMGVNPGGVTEELIELMRQAGFAQIDCTPDSASPAMLKAFQKTFTRKKLEQCANILKKLDMPTMWFFIFGAPGETDKTIDESLDFIDRFIDPVDMVHITQGIRIYPNTALHRIASEEGVIKAADSLLRPVFYVSSSIGRQRLAQRIEQAAAIRPNCIPALESSPDPEMIQQAMQQRAQLKLDEPMFRSLLRIRRQRMQAANLENPS